jgi:hypothetical protein
VLARLAGWLRRQPDVNRILSFDEVVAARLEAGLPRFCR